MGNLYKIRVLFMKDMRDTVKNKNIFLLVVLPILLFFFYQFTLSQNKDADMPKYAALIMSIPTVLAVIPVTVTSMMIAEEKEKNTLRTLLLSNIKSSEILISKALVSLVLVLVDGLVLYFLAKITLEFLPLFLLILIVGALSALFMGEVVGLLAKNQMSCGTMGVAPMMILMMAPIFTLMENKSIENIVRFVPTSSVNSLLVSVMESEFSLNNEMIFSLSVLAGWILLTILIFNYVLRKNRLDN